MTVTQLAQRHRRIHYLWLATASMAVLIVVGGVASARAVQNEIASGVQAALGVTAGSVEIEVDGRDVTVRSSVALSSDQLEAIASVPDLARLTIEVAG